MKNTIQKFKQSSIVFEKPSILSENLKTLTSSNYPIVQYFLLKLRARCLLTNVYKRVNGIFLFCLDLELLQKLKKDLVSTNSFFTLLLITQDLNKIQNPAHPFVDITKQKTRAKFQQKIQNFWWLELVKVFNFSDKKPGFLKIMEVYLNLGIGFCIT